MIGDERRFVFDTESDVFPTVLGAYAGMHEDAVFYETESGEIKSAPYDCVRVATMVETEGGRMATDAEFLAEARTFARDTIAELKLDAGNITDEILAEVIAYAYGRGWVVGGAHVHEMHNETLDRVVGGLSTLVAER
jgi:hypothetical protein